MTTTTKLMVMMKRTTDGKTLLRFIDYTAAEQAWDVNTTR